MMKTPSPAGFKIQIETILNMEAIENMTFRHKNRKKICLRGKNAACPALAVSNIVHLA